MLAIKLQRIGKKHQPSYRLVVAEKRSKMAAPPVEDLGAYNPFTKAATLRGDRVQYWVKNGAQPTVTAHNLLVEKGILSEKKMVVKMKVKTARDAMPAESAAPAVAAPTEPTKNAENPEAAPAA